jgi:hypothetical protein
MADAFKKVSPGQRLNIPAEAYNAFVDAARYARDRQADMGGRPSALDFALQQMIVKSVAADHLVCRRLEPDGRDNDGNDMYSEGALDVCVLKPWTLRRTPFDGETIGGKTYEYQDNATRTVTEDEESENQAITPDYETDCVIFAAMTDVRGQLDPEDVYEPGRTVLVDVNVDGRAWAVYVEEA